MNNKNYGTVIDLDYLEDEYLDQQEFLIDFIDRNTANDSSDETCWDDCFKI